MEIYGATRGVEELLYLRRHIHTYTHTYEHFTSTASHGCSSMSPYLLARSQLNCDDTSKPGRAAATAARARRAPSTRIFPNIPEHPRTFRIILEHSPTFSSNTMSTPFSFRPQLLKTLSNLPEHL